MSQNEVIVILPTYNERENIILLINKIWTVFPKTTILVVDDNSPDKTKEIIEDNFNANKYPLYIIQNSSKLGIGPAYKKGIQWALNHNFKSIIGMDADFSHNPLELPKLFLKLQEYHFVIGSRYIDGIRILNWPFKRLCLSYFGSIYAKFWTKLKLQDLTSGYFALRSSVFEKVKVADIKSNGYCFQIELKYRIARKGFKLKEIPITFSNRKKGTSKMNGYIIFEALYSVIFLRIKSIFNLL